MLLVRAKTKLVFGTKPMVRRRYLPGKLSLHLPMPWDVSWHLRQASNEGFHLEMRPPVFGSSFPHILMARPILECMSVCLSVYLRVFPTHVPRRCTEANKVE